MQKTHLWHNSFIYEEYDLGELVQVVFKCFLVSTVDRQYYRRKRSYAA